MCLVVLNLDYSDTLLKSLLVLYQNSKDIVRIESCCFYTLTVTYMQMCVPLVTSKVGLSSSGAGDFSWLLFDFDGNGICSILASFFCLVLQKFFTSLSVLPGKYVAILAHLLPNLACSSITTLSSSGENLHPLLAGQRQSNNMRVKVIQANYIWCKK